jgi:hypothetical protein
MDTSRESQLPEFGFEVHDLSLWEITCPRCDGWFLVTKGWAMLKPVEGRTDQLPAYPFGRMCPYCSRTAAIPAGLRRRVETPSRRRVVKRRKSK